MANQPKPTQEVKPANDEQLKKLLEQTVELQCTPVPVSEPGSNMTRRC